MPEFALVPTFGGFLELFSSEAVESRSWHPCTCSLVVRQSRFVPG